MKRSSVVLAIAALGFVTVFVSGCKKDEPLVPQAAVKDAAATAKEAAAQPAPALPAAQKPKDHPAH